MLYFIHISNRLFNSIRIGKKSIILSPYYTVDRSLKECPVIVYGLGSMQKGGHWLVDNQTSLKRYDYTILNCTACQAIFDDLVKENSI